MSPTIKITKELPQSLIVKSSVAIVFVLALLPFIAWLLEYKDTITAPLTITTKATPIDVYTKTSGELVLMVDNEATVKVGTPLARVVNTANYSDVMLLKEKLSAKEQDALIVGKELCLTKGLQLGELKPYFVEVIQAVEAHQTYLKTDRHRAVMRSGKKQIQHYQARKQILRDKADYLAKDIAATNKIAKDDRSLYEQEAISRRTAELSSQAEIEKAIADLDNQTSINDLDISIEAIQLKNIEIRANYKKELAALTNAVKDALQILTNEVAAWELKYVMKASIDGVVLHKDYLNNYRFVEASEKIFSILPNGKEHYFGLLELPFEGASKVRDNLPVNVKLNNYPFMEFGVLKGQVTDISKVPFDNHYNVQIGFDSLISTYQDTFALSPLMLGVGEVIVDKKSLYDRIMDQVKSVRYNR
ncbi:MAG: HlyD family efflux transporter periplasmic adaptor subunit [Bacteroidota bacterium]